MIINESEILTVRSLVKMANLHTKAGERALKGGCNPAIVLHFGLAARFGEEAFASTDPKNFRRRNRLAVSTVINYANADWSGEVVRAGKSFMDSLGEEIFPQVKNMIEDLAESAGLELLVD